MIAVGPFKAKPATTVEGPPTVAECDEKLRELVKHQAERSLPAATLRESIDRWLEERLDAAAGERAAADRSAI